MLLYAKPTSVIKARLGVEPGGDVHRYFTHACREHMEKYVPKKTGKLRREVVETVDSIIYMSQADNGYYYPRRQYFTQFNHYTTPGTGPYWDKRMWSAESKDVVKEVQNYMRRRK